MLKAQSSFELLITLAFGLAILLPVVVLAFIQIASSSSSLSAIEAQQAASKLTSIATLVGSEGYPAKQVVQIEIPPGVRYIYVGSASTGFGHAIIIGVSSPTGISYITSYTPVNVSGNLGGITSAGTYLINVSAQNTCPNGYNVPCVYMMPEV